MSVVRTTAMPPGCGARSGAAVAASCRCASVGSVAVCEGGKLVGIFTERDVLRLAGDGAPLDEVRVADVMTTEVTTVSPDILRCSMS